ncbi:zinc finger protein 721-like [Uranotaenia lowii]|uniref:zinc finger protein 721-like n=1 Tax=Uranotaenia lowii TaxID=190385 RepID=UPI00247AED04|nr:zinc finger protein 721-like [Uranotaenia lowii]
MTSSISPGDHLVEVPDGDPSSYCRLCLSEVNVDSLFPDGQGPRHDVLNRIHLCTGLRITQEDDYPSGLCWMCSISLEEFQYFRERCHRYDALIKRKRKLLAAISMGSSQQGAGLMAEFDVTIQNDDCADDDTPYEDDDSDDDNRPLISLTSLTQGIDDSHAEEEIVPQSEIRDQKPDRAALDAYIEQYKAKKVIDSKPLVEPTKKAPAPPQKLLPYQCPDCMRIFKNKATLREHSRLHIGIMPFPCNQCGTGFSRLASLEAHKKKYHSKDSTEAPPQNLKCPYCPRLFPRKLDRTRHCMLAHPERYPPTKYGASTARNTPTNKDQEPQSNIHSPNILKKALTKSKTPTPSQASTPVADAMSGSEFCCNMCTKSFESIENLQEHINDEHPKGGLLRCALCPKVFKARQSLRMHILNHQGKLPYECEDCGSRFDRRFYLLKHRQRYHNGDQSKAIQGHYKCRFCPRMFIRKTDRKTHTRLVHSTETKIKKETPDIPEQTENSIVKPKSSPAFKTSPNKKQPDAELPPQLPEISYDCMQCGEKFPSAEMLREHSEDQHGKPLKEDIKPTIKPFIQPEPAKMGKVLQRMMNNQGRYKCPYCPKTFSRHYVMKEHTFIHTGSLRYRCDECYAMFNRPNYLQTHKLKYHSPNSTFQCIKCRFCTRSFVRKQDIRVHERIAHGIMSAKGENSPEREVLESIPNEEEEVEENLSFEQYTQNNGDGDEEYDDDVEFDEREEEVFDLDGYDESMEMPDPESVEIRDVVVSLERISIPEEMLHDLENSYDNNEEDENDDDDGDEEYGEDNVGEPSGNSRVQLTLHRCPKCFKVFKTRKSLQHHMIYHENNLPFSCDECGVQFPRNRPLQVHKQRYHSEDSPYLSAKRYSCDYCPRIFLRDRDKLFHMNTVHILETKYNRDEATPELKKAKVKKRKDYVCILCCDRYETEKACQRHINENHPMEALPSQPSTESPDMTKEPENIVEMRESSTSADKAIDLKENQYKEEDLNKETEELANVKGDNGTDSDLVDENDEKTDQTPFEKLDNRNLEAYDDTANPAQNSEDVTNTNMSLEEVTDSNVASEADQLKEESTLEESETNNVASSQKPAFQGLRAYKLCRCAICLYMFKNRDYWLDHFQNHANVRPHHCEPCLIKRKSRSNKKVTSVGFKCQHCPKVFIKSSTLRVHQRLHTSELRFPCDECGMKYDRFRLLQIHKDKYHSEDSHLHPPIETFVCEHCPRTFMRHRDLKVHTESVHLI